MFGGMQKELATDFGLIGGLECDLYFRTWCIIKHHHLGTRNLCFSLVILLSNPMTGAKYVNFLEDNFLLGKMRDWGEWSLIAIVLH